MSDRHQFRAKWHDYEEGIFFVTLCTHCKMYLLGNISGGEMRCSALGDIAEKCIIDIPAHHANVELLNHIVMPNHVHLMISVGARYIAPVPTQPAPGPNYGCLKPAQHGDVCNDFHHNSRLANIVGTFKAAVTREYRRTMRARCIAPLPCIWQRLFHDNIVRNQRALDIIMDYIDDNVSRWDRDIFNENN